MSRFCDHARDAACRFGAGLIVLLVTLRVASWCTWSAEQPDDFLTAWLESHKSLKSWSAEFTQTRTLRVLKEPLRTPGRLWFEAPDRFRWELGTPPQTIALRRTNEMLVIYPKLKRAERYPLSAAGGEPWRDALVLLDAGFPSSRAEFAARFRLLELAGSEDRVMIRLEPRSPGVRRFMPEIRLTLHRSDRALVAHELRFADGSLLRNDFTNAVVNPRIEGGLFEPVLPPDFTVIEPFKP